MGGGGGGGLVTESCPTLVTPWAIACQVPLVHGILQARMLEWVAISFSVYIMDLFYFKRNVVFCFRNTNDLEGDLPVSLQK